LSEDEKPQPIKIEVLDKLSTLIAAAFGFVAAFAWNETFKAIIHSFVGEDATIIVLLGYSIIITIVAVLLIIGVARASAKAKAVLK